MYSKRFSAQLSQIPHDNLKLYTDELKKSVQEIEKSINSKLIIKEYPPKAVTVRQIEAYINKLRHSGFKPDVVVIDYLNLINPSTKNLNSYESVKEIAEQLRAMAFKFNIPVVSASQVNRTGHGKADPGMENISESIGLPATCDVLCALWQEDTDRTLGILNMSIKKNRFGANFGAWAFKVKYETLTLKETNKDHFSSDKDEESKESAVENADDILSKLEDISNGGTGKLKDKE